MIERLNKLWPRGTEVTFLDAWMKNPATGKVIAHYGTTNVLVEDRRGVRHFGSTHRIASDPPDTLDDMFEDLLG